MSGGRPYGLNRQASERIEMLVHIPAVLDQSQINDIRQRLDQSLFVDGKLSAGPVAAKVKHNEELPLGAENGVLAGQIVTATLNENWVFKNAIMAVRGTTPIFSRYTRGMAYGMHLDASLTSGLDAAQHPPVIPKRFRSDVSCTVFLSDPGEYRGGELELHTPVGVASVKYAAGDAVLYPSTYPHQVTTVTEGIRLVCIMWFECAVRDAEKRAMLYDLNVASSGLYDRHPDDPATPKVNQVLQNLLRRWGDT